MTIKLTKLFLNKFIVWSRSRYNEYKKWQVIKIILNGIKEGRTGNKIFSSGSYCPYSNMTGYGDYIIDFDYKQLIKCYVDDNGIITKEIERIDYV